MKLKKIAFLLIVICLTVSICSVTASADEIVWIFTNFGQTDFKGVLYADGTLIITGTGVIPELYHEGDTYWGEYSDQITDVVIGDGVTRLNNFAFADCVELTSVSIPDSITQISDYAFAGCIKLSDISIPDSVTAIGEASFLSCVSLTDINIPNSVTSLGDRSFSGCDGLTSFTIPDSVEHIGDSAFLGCKNLTSITIPEGVRTIGTSAFSGCEKLSDVVIPSSIWGMGSSAFQGCTSLTSISIPDGITYIRAKTFQFCENLATVEIPDSVIEIDDYAFFACTKLRDITIPNSVTLIGEDAFADCDRLTSLTIPSSVTYIGEYAFTFCDNLSKVIFNGDAPENGANAFNGMTATCYYPAQNATWAEDVMQDYGGTITWVAYEPAEITAQPTTVKAKAGATAQFTVSATGEELSYQWQYRTSAKSEWKNTTASGNQTTTLRIPVTKARNGYQYRCVVTDSYGCTTYSKTAYLYVLGVKTQPKVQKVKAGATAKFTVAATGHNKTYQWQYKTAKGDWVNCTGKGNKTATLAFKATAPMSGRQYRCVIRDSAGNTVTTKAVYLYVLGIKTQPVNKTAAKGTTVKFTVAAAGHNKTFQWQYKNAKGLWVNCTGTGSKTATLKITAKAIFNGRQFRCIIKDSVGNKVISKVVKLTVK